MDSRIIDVAIGLALVFALTSLLVATVVEAVSTVRKQRGKVLQQAIASFLGDDKIFAKSLLEHPLIVSLAPNDKSRSRKPSYIGADVMITSLLSHLTSQYFSGVRPSSPAELVATVKAGGLAADPPVGPQPNDEFRKGLTSLLTGVENDWPAYEKRLQAWFDSVAERSTGWYKRWTQAWLFGVGLVIAVIANVNPIVIGPRLWNDATLREAMVSAGQSASKAYEESKSAEAAGAATSPASGAAPAAGTTGAAGGATAPAAAAATPVLPALVRLPTGEADVVERDRAGLHQALLAAGDEAARHPDDKAASARMDIIVEISKLPRLIDDMRTPDDGSTASLRTREDAKAAIERTLTRLRDLIPNDDTYAKARTFRDSLVKGIADEQDALKRVGKRRLRDCESAADPAAKNLCLRLGDLEKLHDAGLPIGWSPPIWPDVFDDGCGDKPDAKSDCTDDGGVKLKSWNFLIAILGWALTAIATTLGAPFWFDLLGKLVKLRGSGPRINGDSGGKGPQKPAIDTPPSSSSAAGASAGAEPMSDALNAAERGLSPLEVTRVQRGLRLDNAQLTGFFDANTRAAIKRWQTEQGTDSTGELTPTQIQQLLGLSQTADDDDHLG